MISIMSEPVTTMRPEEVFALEYFKHRNISRAYIVAYPVHATAGPARLTAKGYKLLKTPFVRQKVNELWDAAAYNASFTMAEAIGTALAIFNADPNELVTVAIGACRYCHGEGHGYHWREVEYLNALGVAEKASKPIPDVAGGLDYDATSDPHPDCPMCHGEGLPREIIHDTSDLSPGARLLFNGVKRTKDGLQIQFLDRMKAFELACRLAGLLKDKEPGGPTVNINTQVNAVNAVVAAGSVDPQVAARTYLDMITGQS